MALIPYINMGNMRTQSALLIWYQEETKLRTYSALQHVDGLVNSLDKRLYIYPIIPQHVIFYYTYIRRLLQYCRLKVRLSQSAVTQLRYRCSIDCLSSAAQHNVLHLKLKLFNFAAVPHCSSRRRDGISGTATATQLAAVHYERTFLPRFHIVEGFYDMYPI